MALEKLEFFESELRLMRPTETSEVAVATRKEPQDASVVQVAKKRVQRKSRKSKTLAGSKVVEETAPPTESNVKVENDADEVTPSPAAQEHNKTRRKHRCRKRMVLIAGSREAGDCASQNDSGILRLSQITTPNLRVGMK